MVSGFNHIDLVASDFSTTFPKGSEIANKLDNFVKNKKPLYARINMFKVTYVTTTFSLLEAVLEGDSLTVAYSSPPTFKLSSDITSGGWTLEVAE